MLWGVKVPYRKGSSESILASSLAGGIARCRLKRRQGDRWARLSSFEKSEDQDADSLANRRKAIRQLRYARVAVRSCVVGEPGHADQTTCTRTGRSPTRLGLTIKAGPRRP